MSWSVVYKSAINSDGTLFFPERLTHAFLDEQRKVMGSYLFANQYLNEVVPDEERVFRPQWWVEDNSLPSGVLHHYGFIDPAIGQKEHHDYTGIVIVSVDVHGRWYVRVARRERLTPTQIISKMFELCEVYNLNALGVEIVAYQEALMYLLQEHMDARQKTIPVVGIKRSSVSKETRIRGLVPRFEWGRITVAHGQQDLKDEYSLFPRSAHDDLLDALASIEEICSYPENQLERKPHGPADPIEAQYLARLTGQAREPVDESHDYG